MIILNPEEMQKLDQITMEDGFPGILLMEAAGRGVAEMAAKEVLSDITEKDAETVIFAGKGNNGGDGLVTARFLDSWGFKTKLILLGDSDKLKGITRKNYDICRKRNINLIVTSDMNEIKQYIKQSSLIIDAMLGTGLRGNVRGIISEVIDLINEARIPVLAVDIPSGLDGKQGRVLGKAVKADYTATMAFNKVGLSVYPGKDYVGKLEIIDIGMPQISIDKINYNKFVLSVSEAKDWLPDRSVIGHKGTFGKVGVIGGSTGMIGAPVLTSTAALRIGAGLVYVSLPENSRPDLISQTPELIIHGLKADQGGITEDAISQIKILADKSKILAVGPGLGQTESIKNIIREILNYELPLVLDADGINAISDLSILKNRKDPIVLTPHPGEMAHLLDVKISEIEENRINITRDFAKEYGVYLVLKGAATVIGFPDGNIYINSTGNEGMATAGSGDVLTGIISGLLAQGLEMRKAVVLGPFLHGLAGDYAREKKTSACILAHDIIDCIPEAIKGLRKSELTQ